MAQSLKDNPPTTISPRKSISVEDLKSVRGFAAGGEVEGSDEIEINDEKSKVDGPKSKSDDDKNRS